MKLFKAMATVSILTSLSRVLGFARDVLTAQYLGAGMVADAFFIALKLPNLFRRITAEGAFSVSFVPVYSEVLAKEGEKEADLFASRTFSLMLAGLSVFSLVALAVMPWIIYVIAPGFSADPPKYELAVSLTRITFPYLLLMSLSALLGGVLNAHDRFAPFAMAPSLFNLTLIVALLASGSVFGGSAGDAMAWGVVVSGVLQFIWLWISVRRLGIRIRPGWPALTPRIRRVLKLMGPGLVGAGVMQINLFADMIVASLLPTGAISALYYADRMNQLPLGMVGVALGTALLPMLSRAIAAGQEAQARELFSRALEVCLLLALPAAAALAVIPHQIISVLFERGAFGADAARATGYVLMAYAVGLPAYIAVKVLSSACWARQDTTTPVRVAIASALCNVVLGVGLVMLTPIGVAGIAVATSIAGWLQFILLWRALRAVPAARPDARFSRNLPRIAFSVAMMTGVLLVLAFALSGWFALGGHAAAAVLGVLVCAGGGVYAACILGTGVIDLRGFVGLLRRRGKGAASAPAVVSDMGQ